MGTHVGVPRSINGARKRGWTVAYIPQHRERSWIGQLMWLDRNIQGKYIPRYAYRGDGEVAFENADDAVTAIMFLNANLVN